MAVVNENRVLREFYTTAATGLYTLIAQRAYAWRIPNDIDNTDALIVFRPQSGGPLVQGVIRDLDIEIVCYGGGSNLKKQEQASDDVYRAFCDIHAQASGEYKNMITTYSGVIMNCEEVSIGALVSGDGDNWPAVQTVWRYQIRNK
jgi:hypothetical protein